MNQKKKKEGTNIIGQLSNELDPPYVEKKEIYHTCMQ